MSTQNDSRVFVDKSPIHGRGIFAKTRIRQHALIGVFEGRETRRNGHHVLWFIDDDDREKGLQVENKLRYINHSATPNAEAQGTDLVALCNIQPGAEITMHYGDDWQGDSPALAAPPQPTASAQVPRPTAR